MAVPIICHELAWLCPRSVRAKVAGSPGAICATNEPIPGSSWSMKTLRLLPGFSSSLVRLTPVSLALRRLHDNYNAPS